MVAPLTPRYAASISAAVGTGVPGLAGALTTITGLPDENSFAVAALTSARVMVGLIRW